VGATLERTLRARGRRHEDALAAQARAAVADHARLGRAARGGRLQVQLHDAGERAGRTARVHDRGVHEARAVAWRTCDNNLMCPRNADDMGASNVGRGDMLTERTRRLALQRACTL